MLGLRPVEDNGMPPVRYHPDDADESNRLTAAGLAPVLQADVARQVELTAPQRFTAPTDSIHVQSAIPQHVAPNVHEKQPTQSGSHAPARSPPLEEMQTPGSVRKLSAADRAQIVDADTPIRQVHPRIARLLRWWKHTKLYEWTATGHEDECAFECSNIAGRRCRYWPPLYRKEDLAASRWLRIKRLFVFYVRPWISMAVWFIFSLWFFQQMNNFVTWRTNEMADEHGYDTPPATFNLDTQRSAASQLPADQVFVLKDLLHELIPAAEGAVYHQWHMFVDYSLVVAIVFGLLFRLTMRDMVRLGEWAAVVIVLFIMNGIIHVMTTYPDPWGSSGSCQNRSHRSYGSWIWFNWTSDYCGDQMFSGHTLNFICALIMMRRVWYDLMGWDTLPLTTFSHSAASYTRAMDQVTQLGLGQPRTLLPTKEDEAADRPRGVGWGDIDIRNRKVITQWPDATSLPGVDKEGEAKEADAGLPIGSALLQCVKIAQGEGLGKQRALELGRMMRLPIHGQSHISAIDQPVLEPRPHHLSDIESGRLHDDKLETNGALRRIDEKEVGSSTAYHKNGRSEFASYEQHAPSVSDIEPKGALDLLHNSESELPPQRVARVYNGPLGTSHMKSTLPPNALHSAKVGPIQTPVLERHLPLQLTAPIPVDHGGPHVGGHYGAGEGSVNNSRLWKSTGHSDLPCPEWDDVRGHGMNASFRYRINQPMRERIIASRAPPPSFARRYPRATWWVSNLFRFALFCWTFVFLIGILRIRYHYSADVLVSIVVTTLVVTNEKLIQMLVPYLYLPVDARYADAPIYPFSIDPQLYEENLSKLGVGGLI